MQKPSNTQAKVLAIALVLGAALIVGQAGEESLSPKPDTNWAGANLLDVSGHLEVQSANGQQPADLRLAYAQMLRRSVPGFGESSTLPALSEIPDEALNSVIQRYCAACHNDQLRTGNLSLQTFDVAAPIDQWETTEAVIKKLRANMMPPPGIPRPGGDTLLAIAATLEKTVDGWAAENPDPGNRFFQRLNRADYERAVYDLLGIPVEAARFLPPDQRSANFDNIADAQSFSPTLVTAYMNAAAAVSRLALGDPNASPSQVTYRASQAASQRERVDGAPIGSRGGISRVHVFPADGEYRFSVSFAHSLTGEVFARTSFHEQVEISIDGERVALFDMDHWLRESDAVGLHMVTEPIAVRAGARRVSAVFIKGAEGPVDDLLSPHALTLADRHVGDAGFGVELLPHLTTLQLTGPYTVHGVSETEARQRILTCHPKDGAEETRCAREILGGLASSAFRGMATEGDLEGLMGVYSATAEVSGFEAGLRVGLQGILAHPKFIFRMEHPRVAESQEDIVSVSDLALASRLSFFLWNLPPDAELLALAERGELNQDRELERQVRRMIADPRSEALSTRFASQWLRLHDLDNVNPDQFWFPNFNEQLKSAMRMQTQLFFQSLVEEDRPYFDLFTADYTYLNEQLARHYGIPGVLGDHMRRVQISDENRRGLLGHGSILTATSFGNRTSAVNRGKWVLEVILDTPPPPPPPNVPALEESEGAAEPGRVFTSKELIETHRANPVCAGCHAIMDPIGLPLEVFDPTGRMRTVERRGIGNQAIPIDPQGVFWDGSPVTSPKVLREVLLQYPEILSRGFTTNLMTYALGRRMEHFDQPTIRQIAREAAEQDYKLSAFIVGVVQSDPFRTMRIEAVADRLEER